MHRALTSSIAAALLLSCGSEVSPRPAAVASESPALASTSSTDRADTSCSVVLRSVLRNPGGDDYERDASTGTTLYVWRGSIDVATSVSTDATVHALYHRTADATWWEVAATPDADLTPGYRHYVFAVSEHLFGPGSSPEDIELVVFLRYPDGSRVFDHNRFPGALDNARLTAQNGFGVYDDGPACHPDVGVLWFRESWDETQTGRLRQGGYLDVRYDLPRLPDCRGTHNGNPAWDVVGYARFLPSGAVVSGSVRALVSVYGRPTNEGVTAPWVVQIPTDATAVELWFRNNTGAGSSCEAYDSNYGANYHFDIEPGRGSPRCVNVERESGIHTEDPRMAHDQEACLGYDLAAESDASRCEVFVEGFGRGHMGHYGIPFHWLVTYLRVRAAGDVQAAGMYTRFVDATTGRRGERFSLGIQESPGLWRAGIPYDTATTQMSAGVSRTVEAFAFFVDVRQANGQVVRFWQSRHGANYTLADAFSLPVTTEPIPYGNIEWANANAEIYASRRACP